MYRLVDLNKHSHDESRSKIPRRRAVLCLIKPAKRTVPKTNEQRRACAHSLAPETHLDWIKRWPYARSVRSPLPSRRCNERRPLPGQVPRTPKWWSVIRAAGRCPPLSPPLGLPGSPFPHFFFTYLTVHLFFFLFIFYLIVHFFIFNCSLVFN